MARQLAWGMAALLLLPGTGRAAAVCERAQAAQQRGAAPAEKHSDSDHQPSPKKLWWIDSQLRAELGITDQQSSAVDQVWQKSLPKLREARQHLERLEDVLSQMILENAADEGAVKAQIEKTESARAEMNGARTLMLYRMNKLLTAEQRAKVKAMYDRRDGGRRSPSSR